MKKTTFRVITRNKKTAPVPGLEWNQKPSKTRWTSLSWTRDSRPEGNWIASAFFSALLSEVAVTAKEPQSRWRFGIRWFSRIFFWGEIFCLGSRRSFFRGVSSSSGSWLKYYFVNHWRKMPQFSTHSPGKIGAGKWWADDPLTLVRRVNFPVKCWAYIHPRPDGWMIHWQSCVASSWSLVMTSVLDNHNDSTVQRCT